MPHRSAAPLRAATVCLAWLAAVPAAAAPTALDATAIERAARASAATLVPTYQWFHAHPELSLNEKETAAHLAAALRQQGIEVHEGLGGTGIVAVLRGAGPGPVVLYRAEMDALPVTEATGLAYASTRPGVMHACGHDIHMTTALGTLTLLHENAPRWNGTVIFVGQPAEELAAGARAMLADANFQKLVASIGKPSLSVALHDASDLPAGDVAIGTGYITANTDAVDITLFGKSGHGSRPQETVDPVVMGAETVLSLQTIVSRRLAPGERAVVTVGQFTAGTKRNIIPETASLRLTVRSFDPAVRTRIFEEIRTIAQGVAQAHHAPKPPEVVQEGETTDAVYNDPAWSERLRGVLRAALGEQHVHKAEPATYGEDVGYFARHYDCPGVFMALGAVSPATFARTKGKDLPGLHSDRWAPDAEPTLATGIRVMTLAILAGLAQPGA